MIAQPTRALVARQRGRLLLLLLAAVAATFAFALARHLQGNGGTPAGAVAVPSSPELEDTYGIRLSRLNLTADGGLVDLRFTILYPDRAAPVLGHHGQVRIMLRDQSTKRILDTRTMTPGDADFASGAGYFVLFRNAAGTIQHGHRVDVIVGDVWVKGLRAL